ncbi:MAG: ATP-binding protein [Spirochaetales bacterium]|nr:ATP-binding protein [Spirochaetales bacterium]
MIRKLTSKMLLAQVLSVLTTSLCMLVDSIVIGRFLGVRAMAAYGLSSPILLIIGGVGTILSAGVQVSCSKSIGKGLIEEANVGYSSAVGSSLVISMLFLLFVLAFQNHIPTWMGAGTSGELFDSTRGYLIGFSIGAPGCITALVLIPFLQMAGQMGLLISAVVAMTVTDVALDLLNALVFHWGLFGMGLASALSYYVALLVAIWYFFSQKGIFRFRFRNVRLSKVAELVKSAIPSVFNIGTGVVLVFLINKILLRLNGSLAVAAYSVMTTIGNASNCISTGVYGVSLTLTGVLYQEEDKTGLKVMLKTLMPRCLIMGLTVGAFLAVAAPALVDLFLTDRTGASRQMAITGLRIYALGLVPCCINNAFKGYLQGSDRIRAIVNYSTAEGLLVPVLFAFGLSFPFGTTGVWFYFLAGEVISLLGFSILKWKRARRVSFDMDVFLDYKKGFGVGPDDMLEFDIKTLDEVTAVAETAERFCIEHGQSELTGAHVALCVEEMAANTIIHGFSPKGKNSLSVRIQDHDDRWIIRFRDDCRAFDPLHYVFKKTDSPVSGIRLMLSIADEVRYTYSMNLNNLMIVINSTADESCN